MSSIPALNILSDNFIENPSGIPIGADRDLDHFIDAAESADNRWQKVVMMLHERIAERCLTDADEGGLKVQRRAYKVVEQLDLIWHCLWVRHCFLMPPRVDAPLQLARWRRFQRRLLPHAQGLEGFDWRTGREVFREAAAAVDRALQSPALWAKIPDLFDASQKARSKKPAENAAESIEARVARIAWGHLRGVAASRRRIPQQRVGVSATAEAWAALDEIETWCVEDAAEPAGLTKPEEKAAHRIGVDPDTSTVHLDGKSIVVESRTVFRLFAALVTAHNEGRTPINSRCLFAAAGRTRDKDPRPDRVFDSLPPQLKDLLVSESVAGCDHSLRLRPPKK